MIKIREIAKKVKTILINDERARNQDSYLYYKLCEQECIAKGIDPKSITFEDAMLNGASKYGFPVIETVRRSRQKVQHDNPWLAGDIEVEAMRLALEDEYKSFSRSPII